MGNLRHLRPVPTDEAAGAPTGEESDAVLVVRAIDGDRRAVERLFRRHAPFVLHLATRLLRDRVDAEDVLQETFEIALSHLAGLRDPSAWKGWLVQIAVRQVHRRFRRRRLLGPLGLLGLVGRGGDPAPLESCASPTATPEQRTELALLDHALRALAPEDRVAWMLRFVEGLALEEVAEACECSLATAKRRIGRAQALVKSRVALEGEGAEEAPSDG